MVLLTTSSNLCNLWSLCHLRLQSPVKSEGTPWLSWTVMNQAIMAFHEQKTNLRTITGSSDSSGSVQYLAATIVVNPWDPARRKATFWPDSPCAMSLTHFQSLWLSVPSTLETKRQSIVQWASETAKHLNGSRLAADGLQKQKEGSGYVSCIHSPVNFYPLMVTQPTKWGMNGGESLSIELASVSDRGWEDPEANW